MPLESVPLPGMVPHSALVEETASFSIMMSGLLPLLFGNAILLCSANAVLCSAPQHAFCLEADLSKGHPVRTSTLILDLRL